MKAKTQDLTIEEVGQVKVRINPKLKTLKKLQSAEFDSIVEALSEMIIEWDITDEDGKKLESPSLETVEELPVDVARIISEAIGEAISENSKN